MRQCISRCGHSVARACFWSHISSFLVNRRSRSSTTDPPAPSTMVGCVEQVTITGNGDKTRGTPNCAFTVCGMSKPPSIIFFGGDIVSLVALKALHNRLQLIMDARPLQEKGCSAATGSEKSQLVVVCPFLPADPFTVFKQYRRQYPVARYCVEHGIPLVPVDHPTSMAKSKTLEYLLHPKHLPTPVISGVAQVDHIAGRPLEMFDVAVVVSFRYFLPNKLLEKLRFTVNLHPSLLPRYRGASPIFAPLLRGDDKGGVSVIKLPPRGMFMDGGDVLLQRTIPIPPEMTIREYFPSVTEQGAEALCECLFGKVPVAPALSSPTGCLHLGPAVASGYCDWPRTFNALWNAAWKQGHDLHFTKDPWHAPLLKRESAVIYWHKVTADEAYGIWRAFVGGEYFSPTINATLDKGATPVRGQLIKRLLSRTVCELEKQTVWHRGDQLSGERCNEGLPKEQQRDGHGGGGTDEGGNAVQRKDITVASSKPSEKVDDAEDAGSHDHFRHRLLVRCTFTDAVYPQGTPSAVQWELQRLEQGTVTHFRNLHDCGDCGSNAPTTESFIEAGSAYFPKSAEDICAVKCRVGWFLWNAVVLEGSRKQSAGLLRKGMAMKTGVLYPRLFVVQANDKGKCSSRDIGGRSASNANATVTACRSNLASC
uniref:Methionyl-tRNA formyltransferase n=1 Tax=Trypanosoma brucei TaxID=5691 RepID=Q8WRE7_9TRYP|nr:methionyl-tRNA formyltransferase [Trypanosoma brucei]